MVVKFMAFTLVGAISTLVHYSILYALVEAFAFNPVWGSGYGALAGLIISYALNYSLTFKSEQSHTQTLPKFALIASLGFCLNIVLMTLLTPHLYYLYAQVLTTGVVLIWNFLANSFWTFKIDSPKNTIKDTPSTHRKTLTGLGLFLPDWLNKTKYIVALALCVPLLLLGLASAYPFPGIDFFWSKKPLITTCQPTSHPAEHLLYFMESPYYSQFHLQDKTLPLSDITLLQYGLTNSSHDFYVPKKDRVSSLPEAVTDRNHYKTFTRLHAHSGDQQ